MKKEQGKIKLSPSALNTFNDCARCFWIEKKHGLARPRGIFPSLPGGMDAVIKGIFDANRHNGIKELEQYGGKLYQDQERLNRAREWRSGELTIETDTYAIRGAIDDLYVEKDGSYTPIDYKTRGSEFKIPAADYARKYYQNQMNCYAYMLAGKGLAISSSAILVFYYPSSGKPGVGGTNFYFATAAVKIETDAESGKETCEKAVACIEGPEPEASDECEYCGMENARKKLLNK